MDDCECNDDRNTNVRDAKKVSNDVNNEENKLGSLNKNELKEVCRTYRLLVSGNKSDLMKRVKECFESLSIVVDEEAEFEIDDEAIEDQ